jgi:hypothetical protein
MPTPTDITSAAEELASAILKAAGTDLKHYTMQKSRDEIIGAAVKGLEAESERIASDLFNRNGFMTACSDKGSHYVKISFPNMDEMHDFHRAMVALSVFRKGGE